MPIAIALGVYRIERWLAGQPERPCEPVDRAEVLQQVDPRVRANDEARPERDDDGHEQQPLRARRLARDEVREREAEHGADGRRADREEDAAQQAVQVERRGERPVVARRPAEEHVERDRVDRPERVHRDQRQRHDEEDDRQDGGRHHEQVPAHRSRGLTRREAPARSTAPTRPSPLATPGRRAACPWRRGSGRTRRA